MKNNKVSSICLVSPRRESWSTTPKIRRVLQEKNKFLKAWYTPSLSILTIAGMIPSEVHITIIDEDFESLNFDQSFDIVAISAMTQQALRAYEIAREFKKRGVFVILGGIHASVFPSEAINHVDAVFVGEAEKTFPQFLEDFQKNEQKRIYIQEEKIDLTESPMPRYDIFKRKDYFKDSKSFYNMIPIQTSRGCPHDCEFCLVTKIYGPKFRKKNIAQIRAEVLEVKKHFPGKLIMFADDNLFLDRKYSKELLNELKTLKVRWVAQSDIAVGSDDELLELIYESGCLFLLIGFESINPENLKTMNKSSWKYKQLNNYPMYIENIQKHGIIVFGSFIFGLDNDDNNVFKNVVEFMDRNNITGQLTIATPLPGSRMMERLQSEDRLLYEFPFWDKCSFFDVLYKPEKMTKSELEDGFVWAYQELFNESSFSKRAKYLKSIYKNI